MLNKFKRIVSILIFILICISSPIATPLVMAENVINNMQVSQSKVIQSGIGSSILIVVISMVVLAIGFSYFRKPAARSSYAPIMEEKELINQTNMDEEVSAAIAMALHLYTSQIHDQENPVITMIKVSKIYSPWSSKIYGLRKSPR